MRHIRGIIALFLLTLVWHTEVDAQSHETATGTREDTSGAASAVPRTAKDKNDAVDWGQKLQELEADLRNNQTADGAVKDVDQYLMVLQTAADRLTPNSETRVTLRKQEDAIRELAIRAEVHSDQAILNRRPPKCTLSTGPLRKCGYGWSRR